LIRFREHAPTTQAFQERIPPLHREKRDEKEGEIVIHSFQSGLVETAPGTPAWRSIKLDVLGLNPCYEKKHALPAQAQASFFYRVSCIFFPLVNRELAVFQLFDRALSGSKQHGMKSSGIQ